MAATNPLPKLTGSPWAVRVLALALAALAAMVAAGCSVGRLVSALTPTGHYQRIEALAYGEGSRRRLDLYIPNAVAAKGEGAHAPVVVFFYGGSWQRGEREDYAFVGEALASRGFVVAVADYRVYPEVSFPGFVEDAAAAVAWMQRNARRYGADPSRLVVAGHSAGAHLAMLLALDRDYLAAAGAPGAVAAAVGLSGPYDFLPLTSERLKAVLGPPETLPRTQPITFVRAGAPPLLLLHGTNDTTVSPGNTSRLGERAHAAGAVANVKLYPGVGHIGLLARLSAPLRAHDPSLLDDIEAFIRHLQAGA